MKRLVSCFLLFLFVGLVSLTFAQDEVFHELRIEKELVENEEWQFIGEANFKYLYAEQAWRRWGASFAGIRRFGNFRVHAGLNSFYTFNRDITNFFEVRPWSALRYHVALFSNLTLRQRLQYEWRLFYTDADNSVRENYKRLRYQIGVDIPVFGEKEASWVIRPYFEWFLIRDPATFERFPNERDYGLTVIKNLRNEHELRLTYRLEEFYNVESESGNGHIVLIGYSF